MTVRKPLAKGDDGSGNRYPVREHSCGFDACTCGGEWDSKDFGTAVIPQDKPTATEPSYTLRFEVDGDELELPFVAYAGKHYQPGWNLKRLAEDLGNAMFHGYPAASSIRCAIYAPTEADCAGDYDPLPIVDMAVER